MSLAVSSDLSNLIGQNREIGEARITAFPTSKSVPSLGFKVAFYTLDYSQSIGVNTGDWTGDNGIITDGNWWEENGVTLKYPSSSSDLNNTIEPNSNMMFDWGVGGAPDPIQQSHSYAIRWYGFFYARFSGRHNFYMDTARHCRLRMGIGQGNGPDYYYPTPYVKDNSGDYTEISNYWGWEDYENPSYGIRKEMKCSRDLQGGRWYPVSVEFYVPATKIPPAEPTFLCVKYTEPEEVTTGRSMFDDSSDYPLAWVIDDNNQYVYSTIDYQDENTLAVSFEDARSGNIYYARKSLHKYRLLRDTTTTITHNLGYKPYAVVIDEQGRLHNISATHASDNQFTVTFGGSQSGTLYYIPVAPIEQSFTSETSVEVTHNLGYKPLVWARDNNDQRIWGESITHNSVNKFTVPFWEPQTGTICYAPIRPNAETSFSSQTSISVTHGNSVTNYPSDFPTAKVLSAGVVSCTTEDGTRSGVTADNAAFLSGTELDQVDSIRLDRGKDAVTQADFTVPIPPASVLNADVGSGQTSLILEDATGFPSAGVVKLGTDTYQYDTINKTTNTITFVGVTTNESYSAGDTVSLATAGDYDFDPDDDSFGPIKSYNLIKIEGGLRNFQTFHSTYWATRLWGHVAPNPRIKRGKQDKLEVKVMDFRAMVLAERFQNDPDYSSYAAARYYKDNHRAEPDGVDRPVAYDRWNVTSAIQDILLKANIDAVWLYGRIRRNRSGGATYGTEFGSYLMRAPVQLDAPLKYGNPGASETNVDDEYKWSFGYGTERMRAIADMARAHLYQFGFRPDGFAYFKPINVPYKTYNDHRLEDGGIQYSTAENLLQVVRPNDGESVLRGSSIDILWNGNGVGNVKIELYRSVEIFYDNPFGGEDFFWSSYMLPDENSTIVASTPNDGSYSWTPSADLPLTYNDRYIRYKIKITRTGNTDVYDFSDSYFYLRGETTLAVTAPNGGENWWQTTSVSSNHAITWNSDGIGSVKLQLLYSYYNHNTSTWSSYSPIYNSLGEPIVASTPNDGSFVWNLGDPENHILLTEVDGQRVRFKVRIIDLFDSSMTDDSDSYFNLSFLDPLNITAPNGEEVWAQGSAHTITWDGDSNSTVSLDLYKSTYSDGSWSDYAKDSTIVSGTANDGSHSWTPGAGFDSTSGGRYVRYKIKIADDGEGTNWDMSDTHFILSDGITVTSPSSGDDWSQSHIFTASHTITWTADNVGSVVINLYRTYWNGSAWTPLQWVKFIGVTDNDGSYTWDLGDSDNTISSTQINGQPIKFYIKVENSVDWRGYDLSDAFNLSWLSGLAITSPNGGESWALSSNQNITWSGDADGTCKIELYQSRWSLYDNPFGGEDTYFWSSYAKNSTIIASTANDGTYNWTVDAGLDPTHNGENVRYKVRISDNSNSDNVDLSDEYFVVT